MRLSRRGALLICGGLAAGIGLLAWPVRHAVLRMPAIEAAIFARGLARNLDANAAGVALVDAKELRVVVCGTASPIPNAERAGPCAAVIADGKIWMVDVGGGGWRNLILWHLPGDHLTAVLLTHFHSDHIEDLGEVNVESWVAGRPEALPVYGGPGVADVVDGFLAAYAHDTSYRVAHHGAEMLPPDREKMIPHVIEAAAGVPLHEGQTAVALDQDGMKITAIGVNHAPVSPAYAYRFDYAGRSVVISGDTKASPAFATAVAGVDVMVHEAQADELLRQAQGIMTARGIPRLAKLLGDIQSYHTTPEQAARIANQAGAKLLVLTHLTPPLPGFLAEPVFMSAVERERASGSLLGHDGLMVSLPPGSDAVDVSDLK
jgi:ribonuclease Z